MSRGGFAVTNMAILLNRTKKVCLLQRGFETKGVWSMFEKDIEIDMPVQGSSNKSMALPSKVYVLQVAYSEVDMKTDWCNFFCGLCGCLLHRQGPQ